MKTDAYYRDLDARFDAAESDRIARAAANKPRVICSGWYPEVCTETVTPEPGERVSHGMCGPCSTAFMEDLP